MRALLNAPMYHSAPNGFALGVALATAAPGSTPFPGAVLPPNEGARRFISSISPGSYPKFCGLELVNSPLFGPEWQGSAITNDFRAHRIVRFNFTDFTADKAAPKSGYVTQTQADVARTSDAAFRPIALAMGPDGGLYVADWTNPIINHGEVDFRDPRRDKQHGRIWRIAPQGSKPIAWKPVVGLPVDALLNKLLSLNRWEFEQARRELAEVGIGCRLALCPMELHVLAQHQRCE